MDKKEPVMGKIFNPSLDVTVIKKCWEEHFKPKSNKQVIDSICTMVIEDGMSDLELVDTVLDSRGFTDETRKKVADLLRAEVAS